MPNSQEKYPTRQSFSPAWASRHQLGADMYLRKSSWTALRFAMKLSSRAAASRSAWGSDPSMSTGFWYDFSQRDGFSRMKSSTASQFQENHMFIASSRSGLSSSGMFGWTWKWRTLIGSSLFASFVPGNHYDDTGAKLEAGAA